MRPFAPGDPQPGTPNATAQESQAFERLLAELSASFIEVPADRIDQAIDAALRRVVALLDIDRSTVIRVWPETGRLEFTHSVAIDGVQPVPASIAPRVQTSYGLAMALAGKPIVYSRLDDLPPEASEDRRTAELIGLKSHVNMPMFVAGELHGSLCFGCTRRERTWSDEVLGRMRLLALIFSSALARKHGQEQLEQSLGFERLATRILGSLVVEASDEAGAIERGLREIGQFLGVDRVTLWQRLPGQTGFRKASRWNAIDGAVPVDHFDALSLPWISRRLDDNQVVRLTRLDELPPAAAADLAALQAQGLRSLLIVPYGLGNEDAGALSVGTVHSERKWPEPLIPGLRLLAEVFASLDMRRVAERHKHAAEAETTRLRSQLTHASRVSMLGQLASALAHELSQPLGAILRNTEAAEIFLEQDPPDLDELRAILADIRRDDQRAGGVIERLRALLTRRSVAARALPVAEWLHSAAALARSDAATRKVVLRIDAALGLPPVLGDAVQLQQVLLNLVLNALDALEDMPAERRQVVVRARRRGESEVEVAVADCGPGIAPRELARLFEPFFTTKAQGMGIGLSISRTIVEAHGGRIWAENNAGAGATFRFTLPLAEGAHLP